MQFFEIEILKLSDLLGVGGRPLQCLERLEAECLMSAGCCFCPAVSSLVHAPLLWRASVHTSITL